MGYPIKCGGWGSDCPVMLTRETERLFGEAILCESCYRVARVAFKQALRGQSGGLTMMRVDGPSKPYDREQIEKVRRVLDHECGVRCDGEGKTQLHGAARRLLATVDQLSTVVKDHEECVGELEYASENAQLKDSLTLYGKSNHQFVESNRLLHAAYLRLRQILGAYGTPYGPSREEVWAHTEAKARALVERAEQAERVAAKRIAENGARICWRCLVEESNPIHDPNAHDDCPPTCTHHSFEYEPTSRTGLLNHIGTLLGSVAYAEAHVVKLKQDAADRAAEIENATAEVLRLRSANAQLMRERDAARQSAKEPDDAYQRAGDGLVASAKRNAELVDRIVELKRENERLRSADDRDSWAGEWCKRCDRRVVVGFSVRDAIWAAVVRDRWNILCTTCFDIEAQIARIAYDFDETFPVSWACWMPPDASGSFQPRVKGKFE